MTATAQSHVSSLLIWKLEISCITFAKVSAAKVSHSSIKSVCFFVLFFYKREALDLILCGENVN